MDDMLSLQDIVNEVDAKRARRPGKRRIVVAGEFGSGKSSVINAMVGESIIPCNPGIRNRPMIKISHAFHSMIYAEDALGHTYELKKIEHADDVDSIVSCEIRGPVQGLEKTEIVEIPHHPSKGIDPKDAAMMVDADLIIWVTIASQAWRLSEQTIIDNLPEVIREKSVLAISRADKLRNKEDWDKIETRLQKEASPYFLELVFIQASTDNLKKCQNNRDAWIKTGGPALASIVSDLTYT